MEKELLLEILEHISSAIYVVDSEGRLIYVNQAAETLDNYSRKDVLGKRLDEIYDDIIYTKEKNSPCLEGLYHSRTYNDENLEWYNNGKVINVLLSTYLVKKNGKTTTVYAICDDIAQLKRRVIKNSPFHNRIQYKSHTKKLNNGTEYVFDDILGTSSAMRSAVFTARRFASKPMPVMLYGETGTGKEMFAQSIHNASTCYRGPFVAVNCAAIPENLLESILFGTKKGAFTGALDSIGMFEKAENGTLFLDEINSLPLHLQSKLLRALQEKEIQRIGETTVRKINCRIISATNEMPNQLLSENKMREDLYYRLSTGLVFIPPLRSRREDLELLIQEMIRRLNRELDTVIIGLTPEFSTLLYRYNWPGNVRELTNVLESAFNFVSEQDGYLGLEHLPSYLRRKMEEYAPLPPVKDTASAIRKNSEGQELVIQQNINYMVDQYERKLLDLALSETGGRLSRCAKRLGISRQALSVKMKKYQLSSSDYQNASHPLF